MENTSKSALDLEDGEMPFISYGAAVPVIPEGDVNEDEDDGPEPTNAEVSKYLGFDIDADLD